MFPEILKAALALSALGLLMGILLVVFSQLFSVKVDPRVDQIMEVLPNANCGGCGFAGCTSYAHAVVKGEAAVSACPAGGAPVAQAIARVLGVDVDTRERVVAHVFCSGGDVTARRFQYIGIESCFAASRMAGGPVECTFACLGMGDCKVGCPFGAIRIVGGHALIDREICTGCGKCIQTCPRKIISMIPARAPIAINCSSRERGAFVRSVCEAGCITCTLCQKKCPAEAITIIDNLARIDYKKCTNCGQCVSICPRKIIREQDAQVMARMDSRKTEVPLATT